MTPQTSPSIALFGAGPEAERWVCALAGQASLVAGSVAQADAVVLGPGAQEPLSVAREALRGGLPVLWACGRLPNPWQLAALDRLSASGGPLLRFHGPFQYRGGFALLTRFLGGPEPLWRPSYLRLLSGASGRLEDAATEALALGQALLTAEAEQVTAVAARQDNGEPRALFLTVHYGRGLIVECTASLAEAGRSELVVAMPGRTLTIQTTGKGDRIRIVPSGQRGATCPQERVLTAPNADPVIEEARRFVEAVANHDASPGNSDRWLKVAALWWAARQSLSSGAPASVDPPPFEDAETPPFKLIEGGGRAARISTGRRLALVAS